MWTQTDISTLCRLTGSKLSDTINGIAISALGYTPQFFSAYFEDIQIIAELLFESEGKALIVDLSYVSKVDAATPPLPVPHFTALDDTQIAQAVSTIGEEGTHHVEATFGPDAPVSPDDIAALFHSSGTTGGRPKIIPNTYKMLNAVISRKLPAAGLSGSSADGEQTVLNTLGSLVNIATFHGESVSHVTLFIATIDCLSRQFSLDAFTPERAWCSRLPWR